MGKKQEFESLTEMMRFFQEAGRRGGKIGGKRRAAALTAKRRKEIAQKAAKASVKVRRAKARAKKGQ